MKSCVGIGSRCDSKRRYSERIECRKKGFFCHQLFSSEESCVSVCAMVGPGKRQRHTCAAGEDSCDDSANSKRMCTGISIVTLTKSSCEVQRKFTENIHVEEERVNIAAESNQCNYEKDAFWSRDEPDKQQCSKIFDAKPEQEGSDVSDARHSSPILGGAITSRICSPCSWEFRMSERRNWIQVYCDSDSEIPSFSGCPDWVKPLLYSEYQVSRSESKTFSRVSRDANLTRRDSRRTGYAPYSPTSPRSSTLRSRRRGSP